MSKGVKKMEEKKSKYDRRNNKREMVTVTSIVRPMKEIISNFERLSQKDEIGIYPSVEPCERIDEGVVYEKKRPSNHLQFDDVYEPMTPKEVYIDIFGDWVREVLYFTNMNGEFNHYKKYLLKICPDIIVINHGRETDEADNVEVEIEEGGKISEITDRIGNYNDEDKKETTPFNSKCIDNYDEQENEKEATEEDVIYIDEDENYDSDKEDEESELNKNTHDMEEITITKYHSITLNELYTFIGINLIMASLDDNRLSIKKLFNREYYDSEYSNYMSYNRFRVIRNNLIFHDIRMNPEYLNDIKNVFSFVDERQLEVKTELFKLIKKTMIM